MWTKKWFSVLVTTLTVIAIIASFGGAALLINAATLYRAAAFLIALAAAMSLLYLLTEFSKEGAIYFLLFKIAACVSTAFTLITAALGDHTEPLAVVIYTVGLAAVVFLTTGKDLGRTVSLSAAGVLAVTHIVLFVFCAAKTPDLFRTDPSESSAYAYLAFAQCGLALTVALQTVEKYINKAKRGAK